MPLSIYYLSHHDTIYRHSIEHFKKSVTHPLLDLHCVLDTFVVLDAALHIGSIHNRMFLQHLCHRLGEHCRHCHSFRLQGSVESIEIISDNLPDEFEGKDKGGRGREGV